MESKSQITKSDVQITEKRQMKSGATGSTKYVTSSKMGKHSSKGIDVDVVDEPSAKADGLKKGKYLKSQKGGKGKMDTKQKDVDTIGQSNAKGGKLGKTKTLPSLKVEEKKTVTKAYDEKAIEKKEINTRSKGLRESVNSKINKNKINSEDLEGKDKATTGNPKYNYFDKKKHQCGICGNKYVSVINLENHYRTAHPDQRVHTTEVTVGGSDTVRPSSQVIDTKNNATGGIIVQFPSLSVGSTEKRNLIGSSADDTGNSDDFETGTTERFQSERMQTRGRKPITTLMKEEENKTRKFRCNICDKYLSTKSNLRRHLEDHQPVKNLPCEYCEQMFSRKDVLQDHIKFIHMNKQRVRSLFRTSRLKPRYDSQRKLKKGKMKKVTNKQSCKKLPEKLSELEIMSTQSENNENGADDESDHFDDESDHLDESQMDTLSNSSYGSDQVRTESVVSSTEKSERKQSSSPAKMTLKAEEAVVSGTEKSERRQSSRAVKLTLKAEEMWESNSLCNICNICEKTFGSHANLKRHLLTHEPSEDIPCPQCGKTFPQQAYLEYHVKTVHTNWKRKRPRRYPRKKFGKSKTENTFRRKEKEDTNGNLEVAYFMERDLTLERKISNINNDKIDDNDDELQAEESKILYPCDKCEKQFENIEEHEKEHEVMGLYSCEVCENCFTDFDDYRQHILLNHYPKSTLKVDTVPFKLKQNIKDITSINQFIETEEDTNVDLTLPPANVNVGQNVDVSHVPQSSANIDVSHVPQSSANIDVSHVPQSFANINASQNSKTSAEVNASNSVGDCQNVEELSYECDLCDVLFSTKDLYEKHLKLKHNKGDYKLPVLVCETCGQEFNERNRLNNHRLSHSEKSNSFDCGICLGNFKTKKSLDTHNCSTDGVKTFYTERPFRCKKCRLRFETSENLHDHYRKHFMKKVSKFCCKICYKTFSCYAYLKRHVTFSHAQKRNYVCDICNKAFKRTDTLHDHKQTHLPKDGTFKCHVCQKIFKHKLAVKKHFKIVHKNTTAKQETDTNGKLDNMNENAEAAEYFMDADLTIERKCGLDALWASAEVNNEEGDIDNSSEPVPCNLCGKKFKNLNMHYQGFRIFNHHECEECNQPFSKFHFYKTHMLVSHYPEASAEMEEDDKFKCDICDILYKGKEIYDKHLKLKHNKGHYKLPVLVCDICGREFCHKNHLNHHRLSHAENPSDFECGVCLRKFKGKELLFMHKCVTDNTEYPEEKMPRLKCKMCPTTFFSSEKLHLHLRGRHFMKKTDKFFCKICGKQFSCFNYLKRHVMYTHAQEKSFVCEQCGKSFKRTDALSDHMLTHLPKDGTHECNICHKIFGYKRALQKHQKVHTDDRPFTCEICGKQFKSAGNLQSHLLIHTEEPKFDCEKCHKKFRSQAKLSNHLVTHSIRIVQPDSGERKFACGECGKAFRRKDYLVEHSRTHMPLDGTYKCDICNKVFKHPLAVKKHMSVHNNEKPYVCDVCGQGFKQAGNMRKHQLAHSSIRNFKCEQCFRLFKSSEEYKKHMKRHLINSNSLADASKYGKIYGCEVCGKVFATNCSLIVHNRTHTNERPFGCKFCGKGFKDRGHLKRHELTHSKLPTKRKRPKKSTEVQTLTQIQGQVNNQIDENCFFEVTESSDSVYPDGDISQLDQMEQVIVQDLPVPAQNEEVQTVNVITTHTDGSRTIVILPHTTYEQLQHLQ